MESESQESSILAFTAVKPTPIAAKPMQFYPCAHLVAKLTGAHRVFRPRASNAASPSVAFISSSCFLVACRC